MSKFNGTDGTLQSNVANDANGARAQRYLHGRTQPVGISFISEESNSTDVKTKFAL